MVAPPLQKSRAPFHVPIPRACRTHAQSEPSSVRTQPTSGTSQRSQCQHLETTHQLRRHAPNAVDSAAACSSCCGRQGLSHQGCYTVMRVCGKNYGVAMGGGRRVRGRVICMGRPRRAGSGCGASVAGRERDRAAVPATRAAPVLRCMRLLQRRPRSTCSREVAAAAAVSTASIPCGRSEALVVAPSAAVCKLTGQSLAALGLPELHVERNHGDADAQAHN